MAAQTTRGIFCRLLSTMVSGNGVAARFPLVPSPGIREMIENLTAGLPELRTQLLAEFVTHEKGFGVGDYSESPGGRARAWAVSAVERIIGHQNALPDEAFVRDGLVHTEFLRLCRAYDHSFVAGWVGDVDAAFTASAAG